MYNMGARYGAWWRPREANRRAIHPWLMQLNCALRMPNYDPNTLQSAAWPAGTFWWLQMRGQATPPWRMWLVYAAARPPQRHTRMYFLDACVCVWGGVRTWMLDGVLTTAHKTGIGDALSCVWPPMNAGMAWAMRAVQRTAGSFAGLSVRVCTSCACHAVYIHACDTRDLLEGHWKAGKRPHPRVWF